MNTLATTPKNGNLTGNRSSFPSISSLMEDIFQKEIPSGFSTNFNTGISLPSVNIRENADAFTVDMAVPGLKKPDFKIDVDNQILSISTEIEEKEVKEDEHFTRREFGYSSFKRTFTLPKSVDDGKIEATYTEGILSVNLPKREEAKQRPARSIEIS